MTELKDIGDYLSVPEDQRSDVDPTPEYNADAGFDVNVVPDGEYKELSTSGLDEPIAEDEENGDDSEPDDDEGTGAPVSFLSPYDPEAEGDETDG